MTYTATTYHRTGRGPHACPRAIPGDANHPDLIQHPDRPEGVYVCPWSLAAEREAAENERRQAEEDAERAEANQKRAEEIAAQQIEEYGVSVEADERVSTHQGGTFREMLTRAALAALESKEN